MRDDPNVKNTPSAAGDPACASLSSSTPVQPKIQYDDTLHTWQPVKPPSFVAVPNCLYEGWLSSRPATKTDIWRDVYSDGVLDLAKVPARNAHFHMCREMIQWLEGTKLSSNSPTIAMCKEHIREQIFLLDWPHPPDATMADYSEWMATEGLSDFCNKMQKIEGLTDDDRNKLAEWYQRITPRITEEVYDTAVELVAREHHLPHRKHIEPRPKNLLPTHSVGAELANQTPHPPRGFLERLPTTTPASSQKTL